MNISRYSPWGMAIAAAIDRKVETAALEIRAEAYYENKISIEVDTSRPSGCFSSERHKYGNNCLFFWNGFFIDRWKKLELYIGTA
jgi:hypothetical protein